MTEKHIWANGETITADLLNGMSSYVDDMVSTIPKIDPDTLVKTTALASDVNLLTGTSAQWQTKKFSSSEAASVWFNISTASNGNFAISLDAGTTVTYSVMLKPPVDAYAEIICTLPDKTGRQEFRGNIIKAGETGISTVTAVVPDGHTTMKFVSIRVVQQVADVNARTTMEWGWKCEKANIGPYATPYNKKFVTSVGGQDADSTGNINMDAYAQLAKANTFTAPQTFTGGVPAIGLSNDANIDTIKTSGWYWVQISGGEYFLWVMANSNFVEQIRIGFQSGNISTRRFDSANWNDWTTMATQADITALNNKITTLEAQLSGGGGLTS